MKLSNIKYLDLLTKYKKSELEGIVFSNYKNEKKAADYGIVFGGISMIPFRVNKALELYNQGLIKKIILTGGIGYFNKDRLRTEAMKMKKYLLLNGVPDEDLIIESSSKTSYQNINNILKILKGNNELENKSFLLITSDFHLKRCMLMIEKLINNKVYSISVKDNKTDVDNWYKSFYGKFLIIREAFLLCYSAKKGIISDIEIDI